MKSSKEQVNAWLGVVAQGLGIDLKLDEENVCALHIEDEDLLLIIELSDQDGLVYLYTKLHPITFEDKLDSQLMQRALELNLFADGTRGGIIGISTEINELIYSYAFPIDEKSSQDFEDLMYSFTQTAIEIKKDLQGFLAIKR